MAGSWSCNFAATLAVRDHGQLFHDPPHRSMTTHWRTTPRDELRLRPVVACDESIVVPPTFESAAPQGEPLPVPGQAYGTPAGTQHIALPQENAR